MPIAPPFTQGKPNVNTRRLCVEEGGFLYDSDNYSDDLPFWNLDYGRPHLVIPYTLDVNDMRFATPQGFNTGEQFYTYLKVVKQTRQTQSQGNGKGTIGPDGICVSCVWCRTRLTSCVARGWRAPPR